MNEPLILSIDNGTQSVRAMLVDLQGNILNIAKVIFEPYYSEQPGWAEQDANLYWKSLCTACQQLWDLNPSALPLITGVVLTTQRSTSVMVDRKGEPLRPAIVWLDQRQPEKLPTMGALWETLFTLAGQNSSVTYFRRQAKSNWICHHQPELWQAAYKYLMLSGFLTFKLTGEFADSLASQVGYVPFDYKNFCWANENHWKWRATGLRLELMPRLVAPGQIISYINETAANQTGIPQGLPLIAAAADKACEVLGSGCLTPNKGSLSYGTTATLNTTNHRYVEPRRYIPPFPAAIPHYYNSEIIIQRGFWMVSWFKKEFGLLEQQLAAQQGIDTELLFDDLLRSAPPGAMGLLLQPYWSPGIKDPGLDAKGAMIGFGDVHTRAHIYRAIIEGLTLALREGKERLEKRNRIKIDSLAASGGGSQSDEVMQITANVFGLPVERPHTTETSGLGAAINGAVGLKYYQNYPQAVTAMTRPQRVFTPDANNKHLYDQIYNQVYSGMYARLLPLYKNIRKIFNYPI